jgi:hypothetical protein
VEWFSLCEIEGWMMKEMGVSGQCGYEHGSRLLSFCVVLQKVDLVFEFIKEIVGIELCLG